MNKTKVDEWAKSFVADLRIGDEAVPLDRVIARHLVMLNELHQYGLTWSSIASIIARAGGRRANGRPISPDQLRADVSRLLKRRMDMATIAAPTRGSAGRMPRQEIRPTMPSPAPTHQTTMSERAFPMNLPPPTNPVRSKDVSNHDIAAALSLLKTK